MLTFVAMTFMVFADGLEVPESVKLTLLEHFKTLTKNIVLHRYNCIVPALPDVQNQFLQEFFIHNDVKFPTIFF